MDVVREDMEVVGMREIEEDDSMMGHTKGQSNRF